MAATLATLFLFFPTAAPVEHVTTVALADFAAPDLPSAHVFAAPDLPPPPPPPPSLPAARALAAAMTLQCGAVTGFADAMPADAAFFGAPRGGCADLDGAVARAVRGAPPAAWATRRLGDGLPDGELSLPGCAIRWFAPHEACALLERAGGVVFIGDSLARHLSDALRLVLTGNYVSGGWAGSGAALDDEVWRHCKCDALFGKYHVCHVVREPRAEAVVELCPSWTAPRIAVLPWWRDFFDEPALAARLANLTPPVAAGGAALGPFIVDEIGPAFTEDFLPGDAPGGELVAAHLAAVARAATAARARRVCYTALAPDEARKPAAVRAQQGDTATRAVNAYVARECARAGARLLDGYALTSGAWSHDGTHYGARVMAVVAQVLLNIIAEEVEARTGLGG